MTLLSDASWSHDQLWSGELTDVREARDFVGAHLAAHGMGMLADDVRLVVSELVANAVLHAPGLFRVVLVRRDARVEVQVDDRSSAVPVGRAADGSASNGRGLLLVAASSAAWGVRSMVGGKSVWAAFDVPSAAIEEDRPSAVKS